MLVLLVRHLIFRDVCKLHSVVNLDCDFSLVTDVVDVHYNFRVKKEIMSYPFHVSYASETFNFFRD